MKGGDVQRGARSQRQQGQETMGKELWKPFVMRAEKHGVLERWSACRGARREWQRAWHRACSSKEERQVRNQSFKGSTRCAGPPAWPEGGGKPREGAGQWRARNEGARYDTRKGSNGQRVLEI
jgi:hypothetical protein